MLGRVLFALVWVIIAAGVSLPLYPPDVATPGTPAAASALLVADTMTFGCEAAEDADCRSTCPCGQALASASVTPDACVRLTVYLVVRPPPSGPPFTPQPPPPKLPAI